MSWTGYCHGSVNTEALSAPFHDTLDTLKVLLDENCSNLPPEGNMILLVFFVVLTSCPEMFYLPFFHVCMRNTVVYIILYFLRCVSFHVRPSLGPFYQKVMKFSFLFVYTYSKMYPSIGVNVVKFSLSYIFLICKRFSQDNHRI